MSTAAANLALARRVKRNAWFRFRCWQLGVDLSADRVAEVIAAHREDSNCWKRFRRARDTYDVAWAANSEPVCGDIVRRLQRDYRFGSLSTVLVVINVILTLLKLWDWWQERKRGGQG